MSFRTEAEACALRWKQRSHSLTPAERAAGCYGLTTRGPYDLCLPPEHAARNLLPDARAVALHRFGRAGINWHHGTTTICGNHLLSSQVQCANALAPMVDRPDLVAAAFGGVLDIDEVLPFGDPDTDSGDHVAFEWIGLTDHLGEWTRPAPRTRGANTTSADAAIRYRTIAGSVEIALIEWKYTETYGGQPLTGGATKMAVRHARYRDTWDDPEGPVRNDLIGYEALFVEPVYQLFRLQLLADAMERAHELGADIVRLVYAAPSTNLGLRTWLTRPPFVELGPDGSRTVQDVWRALLRRPDRFVSYDTAGLVAPDAPTSAEFQDRYSHIDGRRTPEQS